MPRPVQADQRYVAGLDGVRAVAVLCVLAYHLGFGWAKGGMLGVGVFFTLSGYLITDLLLAHWRVHGNLGLGEFWLRRARRLLPALLLVLVIVSVWVALFDVGQLGGVRRQVIAATGYFSNWSTIAAHGSYFSRFAAPLPLDHLWSLAIEEQFYLLWPWLLALGLRCCGSRKLLAVLVLAGAGASAFAMARFYHRGYDPTRVYEGTDTRAFGLLIGAALATVWPSARTRDGARATVRGWLDVAGAFGVVAVVVLVWRTSSSSAFLYPYGFLVLSGATAATIAAVVVRGSVLNAALGCRPLRWLGVRSYGIYLWQWPIIVLGNPAQGPLAWPRAALEVGATVVVAALSWRFVEEPIRRRALGRLWRPSQHQRRRVYRGVVAIAIGAVAAVAVSVVGLAGALPRSPSPLGPSRRASAALLRSVPVPALTSRASVALAPLPTRRTPLRSTYTGRSSCRSVVYIGDSTSEGEVSPDYISDPRLRLEAQLGDVGVTSVISEISGARSIVETYEDLPNAATVAQEQVSSGFRGCWILALGTNDVANVSVGSGVDPTTRIDKMMAIIGRQPTLWIDLTTLLASGPYAASGMQRWNRDLLDACLSHPNMRVFDWARHAQREWFVPDGIHYYGPGDVARSHLFARALADAFPDHSPPNPSCLIP